MSDIINDNDKKDNKETNKIRNGWKGKWDEFIGPGATTAENGLIVAGAFFGLAMQIFIIITKHISWTWWQWILALAIAMDISGGVVANNTNTTKRWYHREGQTFKDHLMFVSIHVYPVLVGLLFRNLDWIYAITTYTALIVSAIIILKIPQYIRQPTAVFLILISIFIEFYIFSPTLGLEWLYPALYIKLILGNLIKE